MKYTRPKKKKSLVLSYIESSFLKKYKNIKRKLLGRGRRPEWERVIRESKGRDENYHST